MIYELWDLESNNALADYDSEDEALRVLAKTIRQHGDQGVEHIALLEDDPDGDVSTIAYGQALAERAKRVA